MRTLEEWSKEELVAEVRRLRLHVQELKGEHANPRGAGRKLKPVSPAEVVMLRRSGKTFKAIAEELGMSVGLAHKLYKEESPYIQETDLMDIH